MSVPMKKRLTENKIQKQLLYVLDKGQLYAIPKNVVQKYAVETKKAVLYSGNVSADEVFAEIDKKYTKVGVLLRGLRVREGLSQVEFAKKIGVTQTNLSKMENGTRSVGMTVAKRIAKIFDVKVNYFSN